jgi:hypothetical protein
MGMRHASWRKSAAFIALSVSAVLITGLVVGLRSAEAITMGIEGSANSPSGAVVGATVEVRPTGTPPTSTPLYTSTTDAAGAYAVTTAVGVFDLSIVPTAGASLNTFVQTGVAVTTAYVARVDAALVPTSVVVVQGVLRSGAGSTIRQASLAFSASGVTTTVQTDSVGHYVANLVPGVYSVGLSGSYLADTPVPYNFSATVTSLAVTASLTQDFTLPGGVQRFHVQDGAGSAVQGAYVQVHGDAVSPYVDAATFAPGVTGTVNRNWSTWNLQTDASGNVDLPVFPFAAHVTVAPPAASGLANTNIGFTPTPGGTLSIAGGVPPSANAAVVSVDGHAGSWGRAGSVATLNGHNWAASVAVAATVCDSSGATCTPTQVVASTLAVDSSGNLAGTVTLSATPTLGSRTIKVTQGGTSAVALVTVLGTPSISLSTTSGPAGTTVTVTGSGFDPGTTEHAATFSSSPATAGTTAEAVGAAATADASGAFTTSITVASTTHAIAVTNGSSPPFQTVEASATFAVTTPVVLTITQIDGQTAGMTQAGRPGNTLHVTGSGWTPSLTTGFVPKLCNTASSLCVTASVSSLMTDAAGVLSGTIVVPAGVAPGAGTAAVNDGTRVASTALTVLGTRSLQLSPASGNAGATITVTGSQFDPGQTLTLHGFSSAPSGSTPIATGAVGPISVAGDGTFSSTFVVPAATKFVAADNNDTGASQVVYASAPYSVASPTVQVTAVNGSTSNTTPQPGDTVTVTGNNYDPANPPTTLQWCDAAGQNCQTVPITNVVVDANGHFTCTVVVPPPPGGGGSGGPGGGGQPGIPSPHLYIQPNSGPGGTVTSVGVDYLGANQTVQITAFSTGDATGPALPGAQAATADACGCLTTAFTVPAGTRSVGAVDTTDGHVIAYAAFNAPTTVTSLALTGLDGSNNLLTGSPWGGVAIVTVASTASGVTSGSVSFYLDGSPTPLSIDASGADGFSFSANSVSLALGTHTVVAAYTAAGGSAVDSASPSLSFTVVATSAYTPDVQDSSTVINPGTITISTPYHGDTGYCQIVTPFSSPQKGTLVYTAAAVGHVPGAVVGGSLPLVPGTTDGQQDSHACGYLFLPAMLLNSSASRYDTSATFDNIVVTDTRPGDNPYTVNAVASDLTNAAGAGASYGIASTNVGFTGLTRDAMHAVDLSFGLSGTGTYNLTTFDRPASPGIGGVGASILHAAVGLGDVTMHGTLVIQAPTSTRDGVYRGTVTFSVLGS